MEWVLSYTGHKRECRLVLHENKRHGYVQNHRSLVIGETDLSRARESLVLADRGKHLKTKMSGASASVPISLSLCFSVYLSFVFSISQFQSLSFSEADLPSNLLTELLRAYEENHHRHPGNRLNVCSPDLSTASASSSLIPVVPAQYSSIWPLSTHFSVSVRAP